MTEALVPLFGESPFDQIKQTRPDGTEFWSARDLMPLLGYEKWERFADAIERAEAAAVAQGSPEGFSRVRENLPAGGRPREDVHLSRFAAYLVAMNGDPRKKEVADAQGYFAVKTREAETATPPRELTFEEQTLAVLNGLTARVEQQRKELAAAHQQLESEKPLVARAKTYQAHAREIGRREFAREICTALREQLGIEARQDQVHEFLGRKLRLFVVGKTRDHGQATAWAEKQGYARTEKGTAETGHNWAAGRLTPKGQEWAWARIIAHATEHGTLTISKEAA